ncbi:phosphate ABC transporter substrate-binding protein PstS [Dyella terrae]|uniref:Phosphate-binding protein PstS n=2 Tax=Dyella TaxID=231454 RepID=A0A4R0Z328_9GAMM|nr:MULTISPECIES: phosphate ABC transporter substrate-binding protein PstS [Dyella]TBR40636.1 phosphate ABC transporter substrate-binding protein PstS [Dyella terrae]TCI13898.1 phosphate ABC transporter substrate-binding protein PstS [Dyella soli]
MTRLGATVAFAAASMFGMSAHATDITGAGSSFVYPVLSKWSAAYAEKTGNKLNYQSVGSGAGVAQIKEGTIDFGATDAPLKAEDLEKFGLGQFPVVVGGIVPVVNIDGIKADSLQLDGTTLADIFLGKITTWNDPKITAQNPGLNLPAKKITVVHRSDGSGTSFNFTNYLSKVNKEWADKVKFGTAVEWPTGVGGKGNEGVSQYVKQIKGSIGYVEYAYAVKNQIAWVDLKNASGAVIKPNAEAFAAAAATADWTSAKDFNVIMTNAPGAQAWPITATTWVVMYKKPKNAEHTKVAFEFFKWALENGQKDAASLDYVALPDTLVKKIQAYWGSEFKH